MLELDQPAHTGAFYPSHPELFACKGEDGSGGMVRAANPALHPYKQNVYDFMGKLMDEMLAIFPDKYFHIGTDETPDSCYQNLTRWICRYWKITMSVAVCDGI